MSPEFNYYLTNGIYVGFSMSAAFFASVILSLLIGLFSEKLKYVISRCLANSIIFSTIYFLVFFNFWNNLLNNVKTEADQMWINDHDGGILIILTKGVLLVIFTNALGVITFLVCKWIKFKRLEKI